jgi:hypothetical protein
MSFSNYGVVLENINTEIGDKEKPPSIKLMAARIKFRKNLLLTTHSQSNLLAVPVIE